MSYVITRAQPEITNVCNGLINSTVGTATTNAINAATVGIGPIQIDTVSVNLTTFVTGGSGLGSTIDIAPNVANLYTKFGTGYVIPISVTMRIVCNSVTTFVPEGNIGFNFRTSGGSGGPPITAAVPWSNIALTSSNILCMYTVPLFPNLYSNANFLADHYGLEAQSLILSGSPSSGFDAGATIEFTTVYGLCKWTV